MASDKNSVEENASQLDGSSDPFPASVRRDVLAAGSQPVNEHGLPTGPETTTIAGGLNKGLVFGGVAGAALLAVAGGFFLLQGNSQGSEEAAQVSSQSATQSGSASAPASKSAASTKKPKASASASGSAPAIVEVPAQEAYVEAAPLTAETQSAPMAEVIPTENPLPLATALPTEITAEEAYALASEAAYPLAEATAQATAAEVTQDYSYQQTYTYPTAEATAATDPYAYTVPTEAAVTDPYAVATAVATDTTYVQDPYAVSGGSTSGVLSDTSTGY